MGATLSPCRICGGPTHLHFQAKVLARHDAPYHYCTACDHVFAADPHWLAEAYTDAIVKTDTDIAMRNLFTALRLAAILYFAFGERGKGTFADIAGGYGLLTRLMRDFGYNYLWCDPYANNLFARGFEYSSAEGACRAVSAIEVLEHTVNPLDFLQSTLRTHGTDTVLSGTRSGRCGTGTDASRRSKRWFAPRWISTASTSSSADTSAPC